MGGNGNNGIVYNAMLTTDRFGNPNSAYAFNGSNAYINCGISSTLLPSQFTIAAWVMTTNISTCYGPRECGSAILICAPPNW